MGVGHRSVLTSTPSKGAMHMILSPNNKASHMLGKAPHYSQGHAKQFLAR